MSVSKIDRYLDLILNEIASQQLPTEEAEWMGLEAATPPPDVEVPVLVEHTGVTTEIEAAGCRVVARFGNIASGRVPANRMQVIAELPSVIHVEGPHPMFQELDVSLSDVRANTAHNPGVGTPPQSYRGTGVIVGIIDSGIDYTHAAFRKADGTSRILFIWDQGLTPQGTEASPAPFGYGVHYTKANIDAALGNASPVTIVPSAWAEPFERLARSVGARLAFLELGVALRRRGTDQKIANHPRCPRSEAAWDGLWIPTKQ